MAETWLIQIYDGSVLSAYKECVSPVELGRQDKRSGETLYDVTALPGGGSRIVVAAIDENTISRRHVRLEESGLDRIIVRNTSQNNSVNLEDGDLLRPGRHREVSLPAILRIGGMVVRVQRATSEQTNRVIRSLDEPTAAPNSEFSFAALPALNNPATIGTLDAGRVFDWLRSMIPILQSAACDPDFFHKAAQGVVEVVGLDMGRVLTREGDHWHTAAFYPTADAEYETNNPPSRLVVNRVCEEKKVSWFDPSGIEEDCSSLAGISSVVAAPVRARSGEVIAILYGERRIRSLLSTTRLVSRLDAMLIEVLAVGIAAGLARVEQERAALAMQTQFEQFFTPELARVLALQPKLLEGKDLEITVLFCDIRGFSRITSKHTPAFTVEWTHDVLSTLSDCVLKHNGVLVDYIGDEVVAMWGAPEEQPGHAEQACRAAIDMIASLDELNERWEARLGEPIGVGIGINTGIARVGNTGSRHKFKYGPLGDTVNVASRVQGASKYFKSSLLVTRATRDRLGDEFQFRRLGHARVVNIAGPIELFELCTPNVPNADELCASYEEALSAFEAKEFRKSTGILGRLVYAHRDDGPSFALLARAISYIVDEPESFDPAFRLPGK